MEPPLVPINASMAGGAATDLRSSLVSLAAELNLRSPGLSLFPAPAAAGGEKGQELLKLDKVLDDFIEEHSQCYEFRDVYGGSSPDRYLQIFQALQRELCWMSWPSSRQQAPRVLQCLRLLTRDVDLQLMFFEGNASKNGYSTIEALVSPRGVRKPEIKERVRERTREGYESKERDRERDALAQRGAMTERGRERASFLPPTVPAASSKAVPQPAVPQPPTANGRPGLSSSPHRSKWRSPEGRSTQSTLRSLGKHVSPERIAIDDSDADRGVRLPPLSLESCTPRRNVSNSRAGGTAHVGQGSNSAESTRSLAALLRLLGEIVAEYLSEVDGMADYNGKNEMQLADVRAVAGACVVEIVSMLNRYATTESRRSRLAKLGVLRPLASLLSGSSDVVLRCALETLVHFTTHENSVVFAELLAMSQHHSGCDHANLVTVQPASMFQQCMVLLNCREEMFENLAAQLLEQLLEAADFRTHLRRCSAFPGLVAGLSVNVISEDIGRGRGRASEYDANARSQMQTLKRIKLLRCFRKLARDHVDLGDPVAVQQLRDHDVLGVIIHLLRCFQRDCRQADAIVASLETLAQMCMDDECAFALRSHVDGIAVIGNLLLDAPWRAVNNEPSGAKLAQPLVFGVQCAAARLLRFLFAVERNRKAFKHIFSPDMFGHFIDIGNYIWPLEAYADFVRKLNDLPEKEVAQLRSNYLRSFERGMMMRRMGDRDSEQLLQGTQLPIATRPNSLGSREGGAQCQLDSSFVGRKVRNYELLECVGCGAFGKVHLARRTGEPMDYALKEVALTPLSDSIGPPSVRKQPRVPSGPHSRRPSSRCSTPRRGSPEARMSESSECGGDDAVGHEQVANDISREVQLLRQLDHPNIVRYYDSFIVGVGVASTLWIVMEFCSGASLQNFIGSRREKGFSCLLEDHTWQMFVQLCLALRYLHIEKGIAHRDLTPNNVLVQAHTLLLKIADFGLARQKGAAAVSMMKSMVGTILYSCPEIVQHQPYTHKADVWALGCLLYKMATLTDPFSGTNPLIVARKIVECDYKPLEPSQHSELLINTLRKCLTVAPATRPDICQVCVLITPVFVQQLEALQRRIANQPKSGSSSSPVFHSAHSSGPSSIPAVGVVHDVSAPQSFPENDSPKLPTKKIFDRGTITGSGGLNASSLQVGIGECPRDSTQSGLSAISEHSAQSVQTALSVQTAQSIQTVKTAQSEPSHSQEHDVGTVQVPRHMLGTVVDPLQGALQLVHQLVFLAQMPSSEAPSVLDGQHSVATKRNAIFQYQRWLFGSSQGALLMKREVSRLMRRVPEVIDCTGIHGEPAAEYYLGDVGCLSELTYEKLHDYISELWNASGQNISLPMSSKGGSSSSEAYNVYRAK